MVGPDGAAATRDASVSPISSVAPHGPDPAATVTVPWCGAKAAICVDTPYSPGDTRTR